MAVHAARTTVPCCRARGLTGPITSEKDGWIYLAYNHRDSWRGLQLVFDLANAATSVTGRPSDATRRNRHPAPAGSLRP